MKIHTFLKLLSAEICGLAALLWGDLDGLLKALLIFMVIDYATGLAAAFRGKKLSSSVGFTGILRKGVMLAIVALANVLDTLVLGSGASATRSAVIGFYLMNEGLSILENADRLGVRWPKLIRDALMQLGHEEDTNEQEVHHDE
ncbi:MAG: phage holin family protein [Oscillospiraceae bacterium]|nr:phage holin family protein [Oscillospiraceae bacterium]